MSDQDHWHLYPDVAAAGGLGPALEAELTLLGVALPVRGFGAGSWARLVNGSRSAELCLASLERLILCNFWADGVGMGHVHTGDLALAADAVRAWLTASPTVADMERRFASYQGDERAREFEAGRGVDFAWTKLAEWVPRDLPRLAPLIEAAARRPELRQLLPFTSHESLCFSRCTGYPYTGDCAHAIPIGEGRYRVLGLGHVMAERTFTDKRGKVHEYTEPVYGVLGEGDAEHAVGLIVAALPPGCGPAVWGTAVDLKKAEAGRVER